MATKLPLQKPVFVTMLLFYLSLPGLQAQSSQDSVFHYWLKFPADIATDCSESLDTSVAVSQNFGCGLIAVGASDQRFENPDNPGCYTIFRTHRVINWCEYKGQAAPSVVSRDWDDWHGTNPGRCDNPRPDGNNVAGDSDIYVIVKRDFTDTLPDTVWYDIDENPYNGLPDNPDTDSLEHYWWRVISGGSNPREEEYYEGNCSTWSFDENQEDSDIAGNIAQDDNDLRYGSFGYWLYTQHITVFDQTPPEIIWDFPDTLYADNNSDCSVSLFEPLLITDSCSVDNVDVQIQVDRQNDGENLMDLTFAYGNDFFGERFELGTHRIIVTASDFCGNTTQKEHLLVVLDDTAPAPVCRENLTVELMSPDNDLSIFAEVEASAFIASPVFDCSGQSDSLRGPNGNRLVTDYSINLVGDPADRTKNRLQLNCDNLGASPVPVEIHAWDDVGNSDFCLTNIIVQDNQRLCTSGELIELSGHIVTQANRPLQNVEVQISGGLNFTASTDAQGRYSVPIFSNFRTLRVTPGVETNARAGISTGDMIRIQKHILGIEPFASPYQLLAADLDDNARINFMDLIRIRKMVLGLETGEDLPKVWYFIPLSYQFTSPDAPWVDNIPTSLEVPRGVHPSQVQTDFIAIKIGDANGSLFGDVESRSEKATVLNVIDQEMVPGEITEINLKLPALKSWEGAQFALRLDADKAELLSAEVSGDLSEVVIENQGNQKLLKTVWVNDQLSDGILKLRLRAKKTIQLSTLLAQDQRTLAGEAYRQDRVYPFELSFEKTAETLDIQIGANPFSEQTELRFPKPLNGDIHLFDQQGRRVWSGVLDESLGITIRKAELGIAGTYYFTVRAQEGTWTGQLICQ
ncbi:MAG TPA: hypothetical protein VJ953_02815 [Saprospiraceae bacterium]|nr:hypothetical protein [Saprospiraceae bacterium]